MRNMLCSVGLTLLLRSVARQLQAWLGANLGMATAMRVLDGGAGQLAGSQDACRLMEKALQECHRQLMTVRLPLRSRPHMSEGIPSPSAAIGLCVRQ